MEIEKVKAVIEAILFACGREVQMKELVSGLELDAKDITAIIEKMKEEYERENRGIEIIKIDNGYQLVTKKEYYEYIYPILDKRSKPNLSNAALESLAIIAYNPGVTRAEIESIRGVSSDATIYKLLEYNLIEEAGRLEAPGRPTTYQTTNHFLKMFGYGALEELPELPRYKMDENQQIVIDDLIEEKEENDVQEAPSPSEELTQKQEKNKEKGEENGEEE